MHTYAYICTHRLSHSANSYAGIRTCMHTYILTRTVVQVCEKGSPDTISRWLTFLLTEDQAKDVGLSCSVPFVRTCAEKMRQGCIQAQAVPHVSALVARIAEGRARGRTGGVCLCCLACMCAYTHTLAARIAEGRARGRTGGVCLCVGRVYTTCVYTFEDTNDAAESELKKACSKLACIQTIYAYVYIHRHNA